MPQVIPKEARRKKILADLQAAKEDPAENPVVELPWKGDKNKFLVVELDLDATVLNPWNHRIRSQTLSHPRRELLEEDPYSQEAQEIIAGLLRRSGEHVQERATFDDLKRDIEQYGQDQVGVITRDGVLINGNRRAVALEDLGGRYIEVAVLPEGADNKELTELEGHLQMRRRLREEYSFTNQLLFIHDRLEEYGDTKEQLAELLRIDDPDKIDKASRVYGYIEEARQLLDGEIELTFFDDKEQTLNDLDKHCQKLKNRGKEKAARKLRRTRLLGMVVGVGYQKLRDYADEGFFDTYVADAWEAARDESDEEEDSLPPLSSFSRKPGDSDKDLGLDILDADSDAGGAEADPGAIASAVTTATRKGEVEIPDPDGEGSRIISGGEFAGKVKTIVEDAFEEAELDRNRSDRLAEPADRLRKAQKHLKRVVPALKKADRDPEFNWEKFQKRYGQVTSSIRDIDDYLQDRSQMTDDAD